MSGSRSSRLLFHGLGAPPAGTPASEQRYWLSPERFEAILEVAARRADVSLSFDDGYASDAQIALPLLKARGLSASFFVTVGCIGTPGYLDRAELALLCDAGMRVGTHGMQHRPWRGLSERELDAELGDGRRLLEDWLGKPVREAALPFGAYDRKVLRALRRHGYERVYSSDGGPADERDWLQPRNTLTADADLESVLRVASGEDSAAAAWLRAAKRTLKSLR